LSGPKTGSLTLRVLGDSLVQLDDTVRLRDSISGASGPHLLKWSTQNPAIVSVDSTGLVRGLALGTDSIVMRFVAPELDTSITHAIRVLQLPSVDSSIVSVSRDTVASGAEDTLRLEARDRLGKPLTVGGARVAFDAIGGTSTGAIDTTIDHGTGTYTAVFTGIRAGTPITIRASIEATPVNAPSPTIVVLPGRPAHLQIVAGNGQSTIVGTAVTAAPAVLVQDSNQNVVPNAAVVYRVDTIGNGWVRDSFGGQLRGVDSTVSGPNGVAIVGGWVLGRGEGAMTLRAIIPLDSTTFDATARRPTPLGSIRLGNAHLRGQPFALAMNARGTTVFVASRDAGISRIDATADTAVAFPITAGAVYGLAVDENLGDVFVTSDISCGGPSATTLHRYDSQGGAQACVDLPSSASGLADGDGLLFVALSGVDSLGVYNPSLLTHDTSIAVPDNPVAVAVNHVSNRVYVASTSGFVSVLCGGSPCAPSPALQFTVSVGGTPSSVTVNETTSRVYVATGRAVVMFNGLNGLIIDSLPLKAGSVSADATTNRVYATVDPDTVAILDGSTLAVMGKTRVGRGASDVVVNSSTGRVYVVNAKSRTVSVLSGQTVVATIAQAEGAGDVARAPASGHLYVVNSNSGNVSVVDPSTSLVIDAVCCFSGPHAVAVDSADNKVYVAETASIGIIDATTNEIVDTLPVASNPWDVAVNNATRIAYVSLWTQGLVAAIDLANQAVTPISFAGEPEDLIVDQRRNRIYTVNGVLQALMVIDGGTDVVSIVGYASVFNAAVDESTQRVFYDDDEFLHIFDAWADTAVRRIQLPGTFGALAVDPPTHLVIAPVATSDLTMVSSDLNEVVATLPSFAFSRGIAVDAASHLVFVTDFQKNIVRVVQN
jgi:YVTN family beta-propeller protein